MVISKSKFLPVPYMFCDGLPPNSVVASAHEKKIYVFFFFFGGQECVCHSFCDVAHFVYIF